MGGFLTSKLGDSRPGGGIKPLTWTGRLGLARYPVHVKRPFIFLVLVPFLLASCTNPQSAQREGGACSPSDGYGRFLRYVWKDNGDFYNDTAVRLGYAKAVLYMPNDLYIKQMREAEAEAKANKRGLWEPAESRSNASD